MIDKLKGIFWGIIVCLIISFLTSCKTRQSVISERVVYDTIWTTKVVHDSIKGNKVEKELVRIVPHVVRLKDTTIVYSDTTIIKNVEGNTIVYKQYYQDKGKISKDSANVEKKQTVLNKQTNTKTEHKWRMFWIGIITGILITLSLKYRKAIVSFIKRLAKRIG